MLGTSLWEQFLEIWSKFGPFNEFGLVPNASRDFLISHLGLEDNTEKSPIIENVEDMLEPGFFIYGTKLAMAYWAATALYGFAFHKFRECTALKCDELMQHGIIPITNAMLLISGDCYTAWNMRKTLITNGYASSNDERKFIDLVLTKHPKSGETWAHRNWLWNNYKGELHHEIAICKKVAESYPKNYYSWTFRNKITVNVDSHIILEEIADINTWISTNHSDHCGYHHLQIMLVRLLGRQDVEASIKQDKWTEAVENANALLELYPGHESAWSHKRFLAWHSFNGIVASYNLSSTQKELAFSERYFSENGYILEGVAQKRQEEFAKKYILWIDFLFDLPARNEKWKTAVDICKHSTTLLGIKINSEIFI